jgi:signal transduction histidine kinase/ligand-binding sensor domain-containing protein
LVLSIRMDILGQSSNLSFNHLTVNEGLSVGVANCILKDSKGYIWISTFDGVNRFDGIECKVYKNSQSVANSIRGTVFYNIIEDSKYNLWIGSNDGLNYYDRRLNQFTQFYNPTNAANSKTYSPFYIDSDSNIWLQSAQKIILFNTSTKQFKEVHDFYGTGNLIVNAYPSKLYQKLSEIVVSIKGTDELYHSSFNNKGVSFAQVKLFPKSIDVKISSLCYNGSTQWIGTNKGLYKLERNELKSIPLSSKRNSLSNILELHLDKKNQLWVGTQLDGLFLISKGNTIQYNHSGYNPNSLAGNQVQYVYTDDNDNLWVSLWGKGVDYVNLEKFSFKHHLNKLETSSVGIDNFIRSIVEVRPNRFWCATLLNGIIVLDSNKNIIKNITAKLPATIEHIFKDSKNNIWISTLAGLFISDVLSEKVVKFVGFENYPLASQQFNYIIELKDGRMLASTEAGLFFISKKNNVYTVSAVKGESALDVYSTTFQSENGDLYICKIYKGFGIYTVQQDSIIIKKDYYNDIMTTKCFTEQKDSIIWISTTKGLIKFNKNKLAISKVFLISDGLRSSYIYSAIPANNELWLSTNGGIANFNTVTNAIKNYSLSDGLQSNEFNTYSFCKAGNGELLFGGVNGINSFNPVDVKKTISSPSIVMQMLRINDTIPASMQNPDEIRTLDLDYKENTVSFQFAVIDFTNPLGCKYLYKLEGYDKDWIPSANKSTIRYANLPPGKYTLYVKAVNAEGSINNNNFSLSIKVATPWFKSWWFILFALASVGLLVWYFIRSYYLRKLDKHKARLEKQHAIEQERTRLARELHDGLGSMLSGIKHSFSSLQNNISLSQMQNENFNTNIEKLNVSIREIRNLSHSMMDADSLLEHGLANALKDYCRNINHPNSLEVIFKEIATENIILKEEQAFHILRIVQELLQNVIKHANAKKVIVQLSYDVNKINITVEDDGIGFDKNNISERKGIGLKNIKERLMILKGEIDIMSEKNNGTSVFISCPL